MSNEQISAQDAVIVRQENIATIAQAGPQSYRTNALSCRRCTDAGQELLDEIKRCGMSDDLDRRLAVYVEKTRKTVNAMYERRSPVTKLFERVRAEFTALENAIDPARQDTVPFQILQYRNAYAARKHEEEERRRQAELAVQELARAKADYRADVEADYRRSFDKLVADSIYKLTELNNGVTLENYQEVFDSVRDSRAELAEDWCPPSAVHLPGHRLSPDEAKEIRREVLDRLRGPFREEFAFVVADYRREILDRLPSKKAELERMARADAADAARLMAEMQERDAREAARKEQERLKAEAEARDKAKIDRSAAEMADLFGMAKAGQPYTPKAKVSKKIRISDPSAFLDILSLWWQREGSALSVDELSKIFKKQLTFCEKLATKEGVLADGPGIEYYDDVKAQ